MFQILGSKFQVSKVRFQDLFRTKVSNLIFEPLIFQIAGFTFQLSEFGFQVPYFRINIAHFRFSIQVSDSGFMTIPNRDYWKMEKKETVFVL